MCECLGVVVITGLGRDMLALRGQEPRTLKYLVYSSPIALVTKYHKFSSFKKYPFITSQLCRSEV